MSRPWISCNLAISADGKISTPGQRPATWTSAKDHERLLQLRQPAQALLVGRGTWETDRMTLTSAHSPTPPLRCVVSRFGHFDPQHPMFERAGGDIHLLVTGNPDAPAIAGATLHHATLEQFLETLHQKHQVRHLHAEGGGELIEALTRLDALDELHLTLAGHTLFGGHHAPTLTGIPNAFLPASRDFELSGFEPDDESGECFLSYRRKRDQ